MMTDTNTRAPSVKSEAKSEARNESEKSTQITNVSGNNSTPTLESHEKMPTMTKSNKKNKKERRRNAKCGCEICFVEQWWLKASLENVKIQRQEDEIMKNKDKLSDDQKERFEQLILAQRQVLSDQIFESLSSSIGTGQAPKKSDFTMQRLLEFFEFQRTCSSETATFFDDFDDFWLLVIRARLFHLFRTKGPDAYNRAVLRIREITKKYNADESSEPVAKDSPLEPASGASMPVKQKEREKTSHEKRPLVIESKKQGLKFVIC